MHQSVLDFIDQHIFESDIKGAAVVEIGSLNVNGSVRPFFESKFCKEYWGVDLVEGPGVDLVATEDAALPFPSNWVDIVVSTGTLEHCRNFHHVLREGKRILRPGGQFILTTVSPGFPKHCEPDYWRFTRAQMACLFIDMRILQLKTPDQDIFVKAEKIPVTGKQDLSFINVEVI